MSLIEPRIREFVFLENPEDETIVITNKCFHCGWQNNIYLSRKDFLSWKHEGNYIQDVFHFLSPELREIMMTGTHPKCFQKMFSE